MLKAFLPVVTCVVTAVLSKTVTIEVIWVADVVESTWAAVDSAADVVASVDAVVGSAAASVFASGVGASSNFKK